MTQKCYDIGTIQAFLDGELAADRLETVSRHIAACDDCAILLAAAEEESALAFSVLENEFNSFVPTNRLWTKINDSIEKERKPFWQAILARFSSSSIAAFASLLIIAGLFAALFSARTDDKNFVAGIVPGEQNITAPISKSAPPLSDSQQSERNAAQMIDEKIVETSSSDADKYKYRVVKADFSKIESNRRTIYTQRAKAASGRHRQLPDEREAQTGDANLLGEESYVKTIAALTKTVNGSKDEVLKPAARFAFERDMAVTDDAIKKMKAEVARNPKNEAAKDVLRNSYQNKIDLLNSVAEKSELMASLK